MKPPHQIALALLPLLLGSCLLAAAAVAAAATYGVIKYTENGAETDFKASLDETFAAAVASMRALDYPVSADLKPGPSEGRIEVSDASVLVARLPGDAGTRVTAKVGTFDTDEHERRARLILEEMKKRLPTGE
jgi:hypothetical protein